MKATVSEEEKNLVTDAQATNGEKIDTSMVEIGIDLVKKFWGKRQSESRTWVWMTVISNLFF